MSHKAITTRISLSHPPRLILPSLFSPYLNHLRAPTSSRHPLTIQPHCPPQTPHRRPLSTPHPRNQHQTQPHRPFTTTPPRPSAAANKSKSIDTTPLTPTQYHNLADAYIDALVARLEEMQEEREDVDVEYSAGVLTLILPPHGTYVLNKQPPNKQIWLSSPVSGPKRYDWVVRAHGQAGGEGIEKGEKGGKERGEKEKGKGERGQGDGQWVYLRDGSTLSGLLEEEVGVVVGEREGEGEGV